MSLTPVNASREDHLSRLVDRVTQQRTRIVIEQDGEPVAALVSTEDLRRLTQLDHEREEHQRLLDRLRAPFTDRDPDQIEREVASVIAEVRAEREKNPVLSRSRRQANPDSGD